MEFTLAKPVEFEGVTYTKLTLREAVLEDLIVMEETHGGELSRFAVVFSRLANMPLGAVKKIRATDLTRLQKEIAVLVGNAEPGGDG